jgi:hypothetical protein
VDPANPPRWTTPNDDDLIPEGWVQVRRTDPDTGEEYWTIEPEENPLGVMIPRTGSPRSRAAALGALALLVAAGWFVYRNKAYSGTHMKK